METLSAHLDSSDASSAIDWLVAIGFDVVVRIDEPDGRVQHAELRRGDAVVMLSSSGRPLAGRPPVESSTGPGLYLRLDDVDDTFGRAVEAGGRPVIPPEDTDWGGRRARVLDPQGNEWSFGTYEPASRPESPVRLRMVPLVHVEAVAAALPLFERLGGESIARSPDGDYARIRFASGDELQLLGHPPNPEQDAGLVELTAVVDDLGAVQSALTGTDDLPGSVEETGFGRQAIHRVPGGPLLKLNEFPAETDPTEPASYYVVELTIAFPSLEAVRAAEPELLARHLQNAARQHATGHLLMAGLFLDGSGSLESMTIVDGEEAARRFLDTDPFVAAGYVEASRVRPWANMFGSG